MTLLRLLQEAMSNAAYFNAADKPSVVRGRWNVTLGYPHDCQFYQMQVGWCNHQEHSKDPIGSETAGGEQLSAMHRGRVEKLLDAWAKSGGQSLPDADQSAPASEQSGASKPSAALQQPSQQQRRRGCSKARQVQDLRASTVHPRSCLLIVQR